MSVRAFVIGVGGLLVLAGAALIVLDRLQVFATCTTAQDGFYGTVETCSQSPAFLVVGIAIAAVGLIAAVGAVLVDA